MEIQFPGNLLSSAYFSRSREPAWPQLEALKVIDWAKANRIGIFGIEIWLPSSPGPTIPTPYIYTLDLERPIKEYWEAFVARSSAEATEYVIRFEWDQNDVDHHDMTPYFNITLGPE